MIPLLPASDTSAVLITTRGPLATLDVDCRIRLGGLPAPDGCSLLMRLAPDVAIDPNTASKIVKLCDHLPLAVRIVAARLAGCPDLSSSGFVERLTDRRRRLDELELDGLAVRSCIGAGYEHLATSSSPNARLAARAFRLLGLLNVPDLQPEVVAAMLGEAHVEVGRAALDHLVAAGLLEPLGSGRYRFHDLVRLVAAERAVAEEEPERRAEAVDRVLAYYAASLRRADRPLRPGGVVAVGA